MNEDILKGRWNDFKGRLREQWAELTDNDVEQIEGNWDRLLGKLQTRYGMAKDDAAEEVNSWLEKANREMDSEINRTK
jgi:uncharacterized protein YjbJ (UPF0337 family)